MTDNAAGAPMQAQKGASSQQQTCTHHVVTQRVAASVCAVVEVALHTEGANPDDVFLGGGESIRETQVVEDPVALADLQRWGGGKVAADAIVPTACHPGPVTMCVGADKSGAHSVSSPYTFATSGH